MKLLQVLIQGLLVTQSAAAVVSRSVMRNAGSTRKRMETLKPDERPLLVSRGVYEQFEDKDVKVLEDLGAEYAGNFVITSRKERIGLPAGSKVQHNIFIFSDKTNSKEAVRYLLQHRFNFIFDLLIPKVDKISVQYGPENRPVMQAKSRDDVKWSKPEDIVIEHSDSTDTAAFMANVETKDVQMKTIVSNYPGLGWVRDHVDEVVDQFAELEEQGFYFLGYSKERLFYFSLGPDKKIKSAKPTWTERLQGYISSVVDGSQREWDERCLKVFDLVKKTAPLLGPRRYQWAFDDVNAPEELRGLPLPEGHKFGDSLY